MFADGPIGKFANDLRDAARRLLRAPAYAVAAVSTLAIGIGCNTAMVAVLDALLLRPPPHVAEPAKVVRIRLRAKNANRSVLENTHVPNLVDLSQTRAFGAVAGYTSASVSVGYGQGAVTANALLVTEQFFDVLRPPPFLGSLCSATWASSDGEPCAVISYGFWQRQFAGDPRAINATVTVDGRTYSVAGVMPDRFRSLSSRRIDVWLPLDHASILRLSPPEWRTNRDEFWLNAVGRIHPNVTAEAAEHEASAALSNAHASLGDRESPTDVVLNSIVSGRGPRKSLESRVSLWLAAVSTLVLLIACANVANLVLSRGLVRRKDYFIRVSIGASRRTLALQCLADTCVLVLLSMAVAVAISFFIRNSVATLLAGDIPLSREWWDLRTSGITIASSLVAFLSTFIVSVSQLRVTTAESPLQWRTKQLARRDRLTRRSLLAVQAGLSLLLVFVAGLFATSLRRTEALDLGVELDRTLQLTLNLAPKGLDGPEVRALFERVLRAVEQHPDVESAALTAGSPFMSGRGAAPRPQPGPDERLWPKGTEVAYRSSVGPGFFSTAGSASLRGRDFRLEDRAGAEPVVIINSPLAAHMWPDKNPIGQCLWLDDAPDCYRVIGSLGGVWKFSALKRNRMALYFPLAQTPDAVANTLFVRPKGNARAFIPHLASIVHTVEPDLPAPRITLARDVAAPEFRSWQLGATVFSSFAVIAVSIAAIGLYGLVAVSVAVRSKEIGIRMALGANRHHVVRVAVGEGLTSVAAGLVVGASFAYLASGPISTLLFETSPGDARVVLQTAMVLLVTSLIAVIVPTLRALRTDPSSVLKLEL